MRKWRKGQEVNAEFKRRNADSKIKLIWSRFKHIGNRIRTITKVFRNTNINSVYRVNNTLQRDAAIEQEGDDKCKQNWMYKLKCNRKKFGNQGTNSISTISGTVRATQNMPSTSWTQSMSTEKLKTLWTFLREKHEYLGISHIRKYRISPNIRRVFFQILLLRQRGVALFSGP
jgi:hypothetical protein